MTAHRKITHVAAGILIKPDGQFLLASRPAGKPYAHYWEFPGGKLEAGESAYQALCRELNEEMGITVSAATPWLTQRFSYPHALVELRFFKVRAWQGELHGHEGQFLAWQNIGQLSVSPILPANGPLLRGLALPEQIVLSNLSELGEERLIEQLRQKWQSEATWLLLREPQLASSAYAAFAKRIAQLPRPQGGRLIIHRDLALAEQLGVQHIHLSSSQLQQMSTRPRSMDWVGASTHNESDLKRCEDLGLDYAFLGHVNATQSHPAQAPLGWPAFATLLEQGWRFPIYAIGGQDPATLNTAQEHGAQGIAMLRAAWNYE